MRASLKRWSEINTGSDNPEGLKALAQELQQAYAPLTSNATWVSLPPYHQVNSQGNLIEKPLGPLLRLRLRPEAPVQILLNGHLDTVFPKESPFQRVQDIGNGRWQGPGVSDLKGGLVVMLYALLAFERHPDAHRVGWEVILNPDEEIGSPGSAPLLAAAAPHFRYGLIFEPSLPDGAFVHERMGSGNFTVVIRGKSAHAGREFFQGKHAIYPLARLITALEQMVDEKEGVVVNVGRIEGGGPVNIVPDLAIAHVNVRVKRKEQMEGIEKSVQNFLHHLQVKEGIDSTYHTLTMRPPKAFDEGNRQLFDLIAQCSRDLGMEPILRASGGVCDGNTLSAAGLPTIDTLGVRGGKIHTHEEFVQLDSLGERARLCAQFLIKLATGQQ